jgi:hypothetical protein
VINLKGFEENYEVQGSVNTKELECFSSRYDLGDSGISVEPDGIGRFTVRASLSTGLCHLLIAAAAPNFSQVISWVDFFRWQTRSSRDGYDTISITEAVTLYWLEHCATLYLKDVDSVFAARLGVFHGS